MASPSKELEVDDSLVTGVSRRGRVCKKSTKLMYFDSPSKTEYNKKKKNLQNHQRSSKQLKNMINNDLKNEAQVLCDYNLKLNKRNFDEDTSTFDSQKLNHKKPKIELTTESLLLSNSETESDSSRSRNELLTPDYTSYEEDSFNSDDEFLSTKVSIPVQEKQNVIFPNPLNIPTEPIYNPNPVYTGYKLWSSEMKKEILKKYPTIDTVIMTVRLGEMWTKLSVTDRNNWHYKAQRMSEKAGLIQNKSVIDYQKQDWLKSCNDYIEQDYRMTQPYNEIKLRSIEIEAIDIAAYLQLLGESLTLIGSKLIYYGKPVATSNCISVLLDSLLCAMGNLICLTQQIPIIKLYNNSTFLKTLENIAYIMPGL